MPPESRGGASIAAARAASWLPACPPPDSQEKFSLWNDTKTAVNPFVPLDPRESRNGAVRMIRNGAGWFIAAVMRGPFVAVFLLALWTSCAIESAVRTQPWSCGCRANPH